MEEQWSRIMDYVVDNKGRFFGTLLGIILGVLVISYGWLKAIYFLICVTAGYYLGKRVDAKENLFQNIKDIFKSQEER